MLSVALPEESWSLVNEFRRKPRDPVASHYLAWIIHDFASKKRKGALKD
jgi:hypothetical protein